MIASVKMHVAAMRSWGVLLFSLWICLGGTSIAVAGDASKPAGPLDPLFLAVGMEDAEGVRDSVAAGSNVNVAMPQTGIRPLMQAETVAMARLLVSLGADPAVRDHAGATALHHAVMAREGVGIVALLLERGAAPDVVAAGWSGETPLLAARRVFIERRDAAAGKAIVSLLVRHGADIDAKDAHGDTLLISSVVNRVPELVELALALGADPVIRNTDGQTPVAIATSLGFSEIAGILERSGTAR